MMTIIGVRFKTGGRVYYFDPGLLKIQQGDHVVVETARGVELAEVAEAPHEVEDESVVQPLKTVLRVASNEDVRKRAEFAAKEGEAFTIGEKKIKEHGLDMKLISTEYAFDGSRLVFYFTADERVDFRELVRDLASQFRTRIELRQIGVRDEAKMLGGLGPCGRPVCCKQFLDDFRPVSIKMAKEQNLSLSPTKISGLCGRLMCCLQYEQSAYDDAKKRMPRVGKEMVGPDGIGTVVENNAITEKTKLRLMTEDGSFDVREYPYELLTKPGETPVTPKPSESENGEAAGEQTGEGAPGEAAAVRAVPTTGIPTHRSAPAPRRNSERYEKEQARRLEMKKKREPKKTLEEHISEEEASGAASAEGNEGSRRNDRRRGRGGRGQRTGENDVRRNEGEAAKANTTREESAAASSAFKGNGNGEKTDTDGASREGNAGRKRNRRPRHRSGGNNANREQGETAAAPAPAPNSAE